MKQQQKYGENDCRRDVLSYLKSMRSATPKTANEDGSRAFTAMVVVDQGLNGRSICPVPRKARSKKAGDERNRAGK
jgi:hypothetical protein